MTDTPNARLARVLRLLADVAERDKPMPEKVYLAMVCLGSYLRFGEVTSLQNAEQLATEAARLAGVPVDGWHTSEPPKDQPILVSLSPGATFIADWSDGAWEVDGERPVTQDRILAWRPLPEPYRPEEKTDERR